MPAGGVDRDREVDAVLVQEGLQRYRSHGGVVLEHGVQSDHRHLVGRELGVHAFRLRQAVGDTARAEHMEGLQHNDPAAQRLQGQRAGGVEPLRDLQWRCRAQQRVVHGGPPVVARAARPARATAARVQRSASTLAPKLMWKAAPSITSAGTDFTPAASASARRAGVSPRKRNLARRTVGVPAAGGSGRLQVVGVGAAGGGGRGVASRRAGTPCRRHFHQGAVRATAQADRLRPARQGDPRRGAAAHRIPADGQRPAAGRHHRTAPRARRGARPGRLTRCLRCCGGVRRHVTFCMQAVSCRPYGAGGGVATMPHDHVALHRTPRHDDNNKMAGPT
ncbi:UNVERIFIED_CONTAM: hypothetical protein NCL1_03853 [Trichonephila clavipes]